MTHHRSYEALSAHLLQAEVFKLRLNIIRRRAVSVRTGTAVAEGGQVLNVGLESFSTGFGPCLSRVNAKDAYQKQSCNCFNNDSVMPDVGLDEIETATGRHGETAQKPKGPLSRILF
jgi:hypothetical protein